VTGLHVFGVRHLSPGGAWHLRALLDSVRPKVVMIEGLADAGDLVRDIIRKGTKPPIAILAYTALREPLDTSEADLNPGT